MTDELFTLKPTESYIELNKVLKLKQAAQSGGHANVIIEDGLVQVNGECEFRKRRKLKHGDVVTFEDMIIKITESDAA